MLFTGVFESTFCTGDQPNVFFQHRYQWFVNKELREEPLFFSLRCDCLLHLVWLALVNLPSLLCNSPCVSPLFRYLSFIAWAYSWCALFLLFFFLVFLWLCFQGPFGLSFIWFQNKDVTHTPWFCWFLFHKSLYKTCSACFICIWVQTVYLEPKHNKNQKKVKTNKQTKNPTVMECTVTMYWSVISQGRPCMPGYDALVATPCALVQDTTRKA